MRNLISPVLVLAIAVLSGCGGGSGGGTTDSGSGSPAASASSGTPGSGTSTTPITGTADGSWLSFDAAAPSATQYYGESVKVDVVATSSRTFATPLKIGIVDPSGSITDQTEVWWVAPNTYVATLRTAESLAVGTHPTTLEVRACEDEPRTCAKPFPGSPWRLPLTVNVKPAANLTALQAINGLTSWSTYQGNAAHTGYVDASFDPAAFTRRWRMAASSTYLNPFASVAIDGGWVYFGRLNSDSQAELVAISEDTGELAWKTNLGTGLVQVNSPAASNGRVYVTSTTQNGFILWEYDQARRALVKQVAKAAQSGRYSAPTLFGNDVYFLTGYSNLAKYTDQASNFSWSVPESSQAGWAPATDGHFLYTYNLGSNTLATRDAGSGALAYSIGQGASNGVPSALPVVLGDTQRAFVVDGKLMAFDLSGRTRAWVASTEAFGNAAYGNGTVYSFGPNGRTLEARTPATGNVLWSADLNGANFGQIVVTRTLAFVSSDTKTQAVDLNTHKIVWTYAQSGNLAISPRGVLYILDPLGALVAVNLR
jgi:hypothetical protein